MIGKYVNSLRSLLRLSILIGIVISLVSCTPTPEQRTVLSSIMEIDLPASIGSREPSLFVTNDGRILMSWLEPNDNNFAVRTAILNEEKWSQPLTIVQSEKLFVNWADFPSITALSDGTLAAHWLVENGRNSYEYDVNIALSKDDGQTWGAVVIPHTDGTKTQHGFVTLLPLDHSNLVAIWLDGRTNSKDDTSINAMQLRSANINVNGRLSDDRVLDFRTCSCCQTAATLTDSGIVLVAYRDRTEAEIRDISVVRLVDGVWSEPKPVNDDKWVIAGCPVNGPAIDSSGEEVVIAWFTAADNIPKVNVSFSSDAGETFDDPIQIDLGEAVGRVDVIQLGDGKAIVSWIELLETGEVIYVCKVQKSLGCEDKQMVVSNNEAGGLNFPTMVYSEGSIFIAWTQPLNAPLARGGYNTNIRMIRADL